MISRRKNSLSNHAIDQLDKANVVKIPPGNSVRETSVGKGNHATTRSNETLESSNLVCGKQNLTFHGVVGVEELSRDGSDGLQVRV